MGCANLPTERFTFLKTNDKIFGKQNIMKYLLLKRVSQIIGNFCFPIYSFRYFSQIRFDRFGESFIMRRRGD